MNNDMIKHKGLEEIRMQISEKTKKEVDDLFDAIEQAYELGCRDTKQKLNIASVVRPEVESAKEGELLGNEALAKSRKKLCACFF
jgi:phage terminase small subunit